MKSKITFSIYILVVFLAGLFGGTYLGVYIAQAPQTTQLWAGAKEMQAAISLMDKGDTDKARTVLCDSIKLRVTIMEYFEPIESMYSKAQLAELKRFLLGRKDHEQVEVLCSK